ncbi:hypothetical protein [Lactococcus cremoris]|uniref:hypothetical protein n=1 Tax=Lactococcus lactis subsp. cremoris TaxID=1359 RepID=UPI0029069A19|nr:hypothetical protein [Lactococcus cremoris]MDU8930215.1 hypothetical protein [Lactococcus cremoris]
MLNRETSFDAETFRLLYLPIIGTDAFALYQDVSFLNGKFSFFGVSNSDLIVHEGLKTFSSYSSSL